MESTRAAEGRASAGSCRPRARSPRSARRPTGRASARGWSKVKRVRTIDAVVVGWRPGKEHDTVGALILGLYDERGRGAARRRATARGSARPRSAGSSASWPYETGERGTADPSRWSAGQRARVGRAAPRAGRGDRLRPRLRRAHPPRRQAASLARGQGSAPVHVRAARQLRSSRIMPGAWRSDHARPSPRRSTCRACSGCRRRACR